MTNQTSSHEGLSVLSLEALDRLFEIDLKPLRNTNARILYKMFLDSKGSNHLTTLDIQDKLRGTDLTLQKKEINAWLSSLLSSGLITKEHERGRPTTIDYSGRYTYDLWRLTQKGKETAKKLEIISFERTSLITSDNVENDTDLDKKETTDQAMNTLLKVILKSRGALTLDEIKYKMVPTEESLLEMITRGNIDGILKVETLKPMSIVEKIFGYLGITNKTKYRIAVTEKGRNILLGS
jgi:hypothetical protein